MSRGGDILDHLLGDGDPEARQRLMGMADGDRALAQEIAELEAIVDELREMPSEAWDEVDIPALPRLSLADDPASADESQSPGDAAGAVVLPFRKRRVTMPRMAAVAASVALLGAGVGIGALVFGGDDGRAPGAGPEIAALQSFGEGGPDAQGVARTVSVAGAGEIVLDLSGLAPNRGDEFYTAWLIDPDGGLQALGSFRVSDGDAATVSLPLPVDLGRFWAVDVSIERPDGETGHSGRSVLRGEIAGT